jgi:hypothetical protein
VLGPTLPADATKLEFDGTGLDGLHTSAVIARTMAHGTRSLSTMSSTAALGHCVDPGDAGGQLVGFRLAQPADVSARIEHHIGEGTTSEEARAIDVT